MAFIGQTSFPVSARDATKLEGITCEATAEIGHWVRMSGGIAVRALADSFNNSNIIGVIEAKSNSTTCTIRFLGETDSIFSGLDETKEYYLSDVNPGEMTTAVPTTSGHIILKVGQPVTTTEFLVLKGIRIQRA
jgi:hypothetical protein